MLFDSPSETLLETTHALPLSDVEDDMLSDYLEEESTTGGDYFFSNVTAYYFSECS